ncbi:MAG: hypothetical protein HQK50_04065 [Oligoflexia bacterium]|nr:hypothetical protein [Oligoflexia bacterium]MBF0364720.1 hypothetical protein [Oligoflexia bacterium]
MKKYDNEMRDLFHDIMSLHSSFGAGMNLLRQTMQEEKEYMEMVSLIEKRAEELFEKFKLFKQKIVH